MGRRSEEDSKKNVDLYYRQIMKQCTAHMEEQDKTLPPARVDFREALREGGVTRRSFLKWTGAMTAALMLPPIFKPLVAKAAEQFSRVPVVWLHLAECTGCSEAFLRTSYPNVDDILLDTISLEYHETLMAASGYQAEACLEKALHDFSGKFVCVLEGAIPTGLDGRYLTLGPKGRTGLEIAREATSKAAMNICIGSCSSFGNVQAADPNPTNAKSISAALGIPTVNISGCPPSPQNFVGTVLHYLMFGGLPALDGHGRPVWAYGQRIHDYCERRPHYDAGEYVEEWGDEGAKQGWCLYKKGCKGPYTYSNCAKVRFNDGMSWPIMGGHGCMGCTEPAFWDTMAPIEEPISQKPVGGYSANARADTLGLALAGAAVVGVAAHAVATAAFNHGQPRKQDEDPGNCHEQE
ncbi:MAG TPA: hydrogenase small subunit [Deltaproteobacteria bacterium]|jgi:NiFe hydrogenase small subunit HydA|nr:hydrogenase small subunit [Deltaproteobacteria bacterium]